MGISTRPQAMKVGEDSNPRLVAAKEREPYRRTVQMGFTIGLLAATGATVALVMVFGHVGRNLLTVIVALLFLSLCTVAFSTIAWVAHAWAARHDRP